MLRNKILSKDPFIRLVLAFYYFVGLNDNWNNRIENVISDKIKGLSDYDFEYDKHLYSFYYQYVNNNEVRCCIKEYQVFYDNAKSYLYIVFDYDLINKNIIKVYEREFASMTG